ncbi:MAG: hypothetical protein KY469_17045 [Actinobacteria bacterium]|nr:hypothetical protein [Actinomycetota bacterium]
MLARKLTGLAAAALALGLVGVTTTGDRAVGTALTDMTAVEFEVHGLDVPSVTIADIATYASTDTNAAENVIGNGAPFALADILPVVVGDQAIGAIQARSNGANSNSGSALAQTLGLLDVEINPAKVTAAATAQEATAVAELATAQIESVADVLGLDFEVNTAGIASRVTQGSASASQGLEVTGVNVTLGDLLPADLLGQLPLGTLMALLEALPVDVSVDVEAMVDAITGAVDAVATAVAGLTEASAALADAVAAALDTQALVAELTADAALTTPGDLLDLVTKYATECPDADVTDILDCVGGLLADAEARLLLDLDAVTQAVGVVVTLIGDLGDALNDLVDALTSVDGTDLDAVLDALAGGELLDIGAIQVGVIATATDAAETTNATVGCNEVPVRALGIDIVTPSCREPLETTSAVAAQVTGAVEGVIGILPLVADIVPDVRFGMFTDLVESTSTDGTYNRANAGVTALELGIDPVTLCADCIVDGLLEDVLGLAGDVVGNVALPEGTVLDGLGLTDLVDDIDGAAAALPDLDTLTATLQGLLDALPLDGLVEDVTVPGFDLVVDPVSTASFAVVPAAAPPAAPNPPASPTTPGAPSLPTTGGGFALLGGLLAAGALAFRRRG